MNVIRHRRLSFPINTGNDISNICSGDSPDRLVSDNRENSILEDSLNSDAMTRTKLR